MEGLLPLAILLGASGSLLATKKYTTTKRRAREGFQSIVDPSVAEAMPPQHTRYVETGAMKYNKTQNLMDPQNNVLLPPDFTSGDVKRQEGKLRGAFRSALASPRDPSFNVQADKKLDVLLNAGGKGTAIDFMKKCEAITSIDCNAFNNPDFAGNCGICFDGGENSKAQPHIGGLFVTEDDKAVAEAMAKRMNSRKINYSPSVGKCAPNMMVTTKAQCESLKKQLACQTNQSFDGAGCNQCFQDSMFRYVAPDIVKGEPQLVLSGSGTLAVIKVGSNEIDAKLTLSSSPTTVELPGFNEGDTLQLNLTPASATVAGYLIGITPSGDFRVDIARLINVDILTNARPRLSGIMRVGEDNYTVLRPGRGKDSARLVLFNPFTFLEPSEQEAIDCGTTPYIANETSATFLESSPCFKKGQKPGAYSLQCLQQTFVDAGCTEQGEAYPSNSSKASDMLYGPGGKALTIGEIAGKIYEKSLTAYTGLKEDGSKLSVKDWDAVSRFCTGRSITSPCDFDNKESGPLSKECLSYLWKNTGAVENVPGNVGPTYLSGTKVASLNNMNNDRFCTTKGSLAPVDENGQPNQKAIDIANQYRGVNAVKAFYNQIHGMANDNTRSDEGRKLAIDQCYGITLEQLPVEKPSEETAKIETTCSPQTLLDAVTSTDGSVNNKELGTVQVKDNWVLSFTINPVGPQPKWQEPLMITTTPNYRDSDGEGLGSRCPLISIIPGSLQFYVSFYGRNGLWVSPQLPALVANTDTTVTVTKANGVVTVRMTGGVDKNVSIPCKNVKAYQGPAKVIVNRLLNQNHCQPFKGSMKNVSYCSYDERYPSVLDYKPGRTKSSMEQSKELEINYNDPADWSAYQCPVHVLGGYGAAPWGKWWAPGFPDDGTAKWIWSKPNADRQDMDNNWYAFYKKLPNTTGETIQCTVTIASDNVGWFGFNGQVISNGWTGVGTFNISIPPGENAIHINAANQGGPAGLIVIGKDSSGKTVFVTDGTWLTHSNLCGK